MQTSQLASCSSKRLHVNNDVDNNDPEKRILPSSKRVKILLSPTDLEFPIRFDGREDKIYAGDFVSYIPDDVTVQIFSLLDMGKVFLARLKLVSKAWNALLSTRWSQLSTKLTLSGLISSGSWKNFYNISFHKLSHRGTAKRCLISKIPLGSFLIDSNKGLLLFKSISPRHPTELIVGHASTGVLDHLPCAFTTENVVHMNHGLIPKSHGCYKVATLSILAGLGMLLKIFSSGTKEIKIVEVMVPAQVVISPNEIVTAFFYFKGMLYYSILDWLLVHQLRDGCSTFVKLPVNGCIVPKGQRLVWQSEGHLYYAFGYSDPQPGFQIWELVFEQQHCYNFEGIKRSKWRMICSHFLTDVKNEYTRLFKGEVEEDNDLSVCKPFAFNDDFQILCIELQGMILSYHLRTRVFAKTCKF